MALGWDRRPRSHAPDALAEAVAGVAAIAHDPLRHARQASEERDRVGEFMRLPRRDPEGDGAPLPSAITQALVP